MKFGQLIEYNKKYFSSKLSFSTFRYPSTNLNILRTKRAFFHHFLRAFSCQKLPEAWKCAFKFNVFEIRESPLRPNTQLLHESVKLLHLRNCNWKRRSTVICFHWYKLQGSEWSKSLNSKLTRINIYWGYQQISSVKRQKGKSQDGCNKKVSYPLICIRTFHVHEGRFWENLACFIFLLHSSWDSPFCLITDNITRKNCTIGCVYKHPKRPIQKVSNILMPILDKISAEIKEACLMGHFNIKFINYDSHNTTFQFLDSI